MKSFLINLLKLAVAAIFVIALDIIIPFSSAGGLGFVKQHGKWLLFVIGFVNVVIGGAISGGFWSKSIKTGFENWFKPTIIKGQLNPTKVFAAITLVFNVLAITLGVEP
jgi:hypothetical protein